MFSLPCTPQPSPVDNASLSPPRYGAIYYERPFRTMSIRSYENEEEKEEQQLSEGNNIYASNEPETWSLDDSYSCSPNEPETWSLDDPYSSDEESEFIFRGPAINKQEHPEEEEEEEPDTFFPMEMDDHYHHTNSKNGSKKVIRNTGFDSPVPNIPVSRITPSIKRVHAQAKRDITPARLRALRTGQSSFLYCDVKPQTHLP